MPIYEFICKECGEHFESLVPVGGEKNVLCLKCRSNNIQKLFSSFGIGGTSNRLTGSSNSCVACSTKTCPTCK